MSYPVPRLSAALLLLAPLLLVGLASAAEPPAPRPISHEDVWLMKRPGALAASPDGKWFVVGVTEPSYEEDQRRSDLWIVPSDGSAAPRRLTTGRGSEGDPVFSTDSTRLAFSAKREDDDSAQIYLLDLAGGEAQRVTSWPGGVKSPRFSPDGRTLLFVGVTHPGAVTDEDNRKAAAERKARKHNVRAYDSFPIRHWDRWLDELRPSLLVQPLDGASPARDLLAGSKLRDERGFGGRLGNDGETLEAAWTPDGSGVVFAATTNRHEAARAEVNTALWHVRLDGGEPRRLTGDEGDYSSPEFTRDGKVLLAKVQPASDKWVYTASRLVRWSWPSLDGSKVLTADFDESVGQYVPAPDNRRVFFLAERAGHDQLFEVTLAGGKVSELGKLEAGTYSRIAVGGTAKAPTMAAIWSSAVNPHELGRVDLANGRWSRISTFNTARAAAIDWQPAEQFWFTSSRGKRIHSLLVKPPGFDPNRKYPLFVLIHGGPHDVEGRLHLPLELPPARAAGLRGAAHQLQRLDGLRRGVRAQHPGRPAGGARQRDQRGGRRGDQALRVHRRRAAGGRRRELRRSPRQLARRDDRPISRAGEPRGALRPAQPVDHERRRVQPRAQHRRTRLGITAAVWREQSPFCRSAQLRTPILLTYGEKDYRVPLNNALEFWTVLQRQHVPSRLVVFPDENHWVLKGENSRFFYAEVQGWLAKYL
jgi:dipeptidyl aminopeptidase/acylaminoacyl peptidase